MLGEAALDLVVELVFAVFKVRLDGRHGLPQPLNVALEVLLYLFVRAVGDDALVPRGIACFDLLSRLHGNGVELGARRVELLAARGPRFLQVGDLLHLAAIGDHHLRLRGGALLDLRVQCGSNICQLNLGEGDFLLRGGDFGFQVVDDGLERAALREEELFVLLQFLDLQGRRCLYGLQLSRGGVQILLASADVFGKVVDHRLRRAALHQALLLGSSDFLDSLGELGVTRVRCLLGVGQHIFAPPDVLLQVRDNGALRAALGDARLDRRSRRGELGGHVLRRFSELSDGAVQASLASVDVGLEVVDDGFARAVLGEALLLRCGELLDLRRGRGVGFRERGGGLVQVRFALVHVGIEVIDDCRVRAVSHE